MAKKKIAARTNWKDLYFRLEGPVRIKPQSFSAREIATVILNLEDSCRLVAKNDHPELDETQLYISLIEVVHDSAGLRFVPSFKAVGAAFITLASCINDGSYDKIPVAAVSKLKEIQKVITHKPGCKASFISGKKKISEITNKTDIEIPTISNIEGETVLYGEVTRVGGSEPKIVLRLHNGDLLSLDVNEDLARVFGSKLYTQVGLKGFATWSYHDNKIIRFKVDSLTEFEQIGVNEAIKQLRGSIGEYWDNIDNIEEALLIGD